TSGCCSCSWAGPEEVLQILFADPDLPADPVGGQLAALDAPADRLLRDAEALRDGRNGMKGRRLIRRPVALAGQLAWLRSQVGHSPRPGAMRRFAPAGLHRSISSGVGSAP